eukprot:c19988_g1_i2 orf=750-2810(+)
MTEHYHDLEHEVSGVVQSEEDAKWAIDKASHYIKERKFERALSLLAKAERLCPHIKGLPEIVAVAEVCYAATWTPCSCSAKPQRQNYPDWYHILKVDEKAGINTIKKKYHQLALLLHPDKNKHVGAEEAFKLVSEAYSHLSDKQKRVLFNLERLKRQCRHCSTLTQGQMNTEAIVYSFRGRLKGQNRTGLSKDYFNADIHRAEWRIEKEKLQMFRERARAGVKSVSDVFRERTRLTNEVEMPWEKFQSKSGDNLKESSTWTRKDYKQELLHQFHCMQQGKREKGNAVYMAHIRSSQVKKETLFPSVTSNLDKCRRNAMHGESPQVLQSLDGLLGMLREEIGANPNTTRESHLHVSNMLGTVKEEIPSVLDPYNKVDHMTCDEHATSFKQCSKDNSATCLEQMSDDCAEESSVIDDFLAGLEYSVGEENKSSATLDPLVQNSPGRNHAGLQEGISKKTTDTTQSCTFNDDDHKLENKTGDVHTSSVKKPEDPNQQSFSRVDNIVETTELQKNAKLGVAAQSNIVAPISIVSNSLNENATVVPASVKIWRTSLKSAKEFRVSSHSSDGVVKFPTSALKTFPNATSTIFKEVDTNTFLGKSSGKMANESKISRERDASKDYMVMEQCILQSQKQKSDQLLRTLERLREETRSVAATLDKIKNSVGSDTSYVGAMFPGSCHMAAASMVAT